MMSTADEPRIRLGSAPDSGPEIARRTRGHLGSCGIGRGGVPNRYATREVVR